VPYTATFDGNFQKLDKAVNDANQKMEVFQISVKGVQRQLQQMVSSLDGSKIVREATIAAAAIEKIGGVTKLTEAEQKKLAATVGEAVAKFRALGETVPKSIQAIADQLKAVDQQAGLKKVVAGFNDVGAAAGPIGSVVSGVSTKLGALGATAAAIGPVGIAVAGVGVAVVGLGAAVATVAGKLLDITKTAADLGDKMKVLSQQTGLSTEFLTKMRFVADQTDAPLEAITSAVFKMSQGVAEGGKKVKAGLDAIGLSVAEVRNMNAEAAFEAVISGLGKIPEEGKRAAAGVAIFGKQFKEISQLTQEDIKALGDRAKELGIVFGDDFSEAGDRLNDAIGQMRSRFEGLELQLGKELLPIAIAVAEGVMSAFDSAFESAGVDASDFANIIERMVVAVIQATAKMISVIAQVADVVVQFVAGKFIKDFGIIEVFSNIAAAYLKVAKALDKATPFVDNSKDIASFQALNDQIRDFAKNAQTGTAAVSAGFSRASQAVQEMAEKVGRDLPANLAKTKKELHDSVSASDKNRDALNRLIGSIDGLGGSADKNKHKIRGLSDELVESIKKAALFARDIEKLGGVTKLTSDQQDKANKVLREGMEAMQAMGRTGDPLYQTLVNLATATTNWGKSFGTVKLGIDDVIAAAGKVDQKKFELLNDLQFGDLGTEVSKVKLGLPGGIGLNAPNADEAFMPKGRKGRDTIDQMLGFAASGNGAVSQFANTFRDARQAQQQFGKFGIGSQMFTGSVGNRVAAGAAAGVGVVQGAQDVWAATDKAGAGERALGGALAGAKAGAMFGPWGMAIGAAAGLVIGLVRGKPEWAKAADEVGRDFGVKISAALGKEIAKTAKELFKGDRSTASQFHLGDIIKEAGGINDQNFDKMTSKLRDTYSFLERGQFNKEQATKVIEENFGAFAQHVLESTHLASKGFQELFALNKRFGLESAEMRKFVEGQTSVLGGSIAALAAPLSEKYDGLAESIKAATKEVNALAAEGKEGTDEYKDAVADLTILQHMQAQGAMASAEELERLGIIAVGAFNAAIAGGMGYVEAIEAMGPALDTLIGIQKDLGIETQNAALAELTSFRDRVNGNKTLVLAAEALGETMRALASIGGLNNETLAAMEVQGVQTFERLKAAGFSENQALMMMKGFLENVIEGHEQLGTPIDENTQKLIDQAREAGILKDKTKTSTDVMQLGFDKVTGAVGLLAKALGVDVPAAIQDAIDKLNEIPRDIDVNVNVNTNGSPGLPDGSDGGGMPGAAGGIYATGSRGVATWFGEGGQPELGGPVDFMGDVLSHAIARLGGGGRAGGGGKQEIHVHVMLPNGRELAHAILPEMPEALAFYGGTR
jgi:hypothetical protein